MLQAYSNSDSTNYFDRSLQLSWARCISYAWQFSSTMTRHSLIEPVEYDFVCYCHNADSTDTRLITEFDQAIDDRLAKLPRKNHQTNGIKIISFR